MATTASTWIDRLERFIAPRWHLQRLRARIAGDLVRRNYDAASMGRRTQGWRRSSTDAAQATGPFLGLLRDRARHLVRNNAYAESGLRSIVDDTVGWGIIGKPIGGSAAARDLWKVWAETSACDADGQHDLYGLQKLVMRTIVESGEVLIRRRLRRPEDGLPVPMQLQILEPDFLDTSKDSLGGLVNGRRIIQGVEYDPIGRRTAYWLFPEHPGSEFATSVSVRVPAQNIAHLYAVGRPGQVRGVSWFAPVLVRFNDFDELEDATLMKQKIAACLAVITSDIDGSSPPLGTTDTSKDPQVDSLEPGMIMNLPPGRSVSVVEPPSVREYADFARTSLRAIAAGMGVTYEDLTGDYSDLPFSAARMSRLRHWARIEDWRWRMLIPGFCDRAWSWFSEVAAIFGTQTGGAIRWTAPPAPMIDPAAEGLAYQRNIRTGIQTLSDSLRERGFDPETVFAEMAEDYTAIDRLGLILDSDPRQTTQAGQLQGKAVPEKPAAVAPTVPDPNANAFVAHDLLAVRDALERIERGILRAPRPNGNGHGAPPSIMVDARTSVTAPAAPAAPISVDARTTIADGAIHVTPAAAPRIDIHSPVTVTPAHVTIAKGAIQTEVPITVADAVHLPSQRKRIERDSEGRVSAIVEEATPARGRRTRVKRAGDGRVEGLEDEPQTTTPGDEE